MKTRKICKLSPFLALLWLTLGVTAQNRYKESFPASNDMIVEVQTSYANVVFETWDKNKVEVEAFVEGKDLSEKEKKEIFDNWKLDVLGNSKKVVITSIPTNFGEGIGALGGLEALKSLKALKALENIPVMPEMPNLDLNFNFDIPKVPEFRKSPSWPFTKDRPSIKNKDEFRNFHFNDETNIVFDQEAYEKNKQGYVTQLNKKYNTQVSVKQVDAWLNEVDQWADEFSGVMEQWGEEFGKSFSEKFSPDFEKKMEQWGEEFGEKFGKEMEAWGEEFGEKFGKDMEAWGEQFGKEMEEWAKQFEENGGNYSQQVITDKNGNKQILFEGKKGMNFSGKANKTIIVRMPKGTKTVVNVKYGELKMASAYNLKATLNYATLTANSIDGGKTLINASYAPVYVNTWNQGSLSVNYVEDCRLNTVSEINLQSNSSEVNINELLGNGTLSGSFGNLSVLKISPNFTSLDIQLENTDAAVSLPNTAFNFYYNGKKSQFSPPKSLQLTETKNFDRTLVKGYYKANTSNKSITINANYSNLSLQ
ncbi:MAG: hypothetical protein R2793_06655 [Flavobacteriaceae bacterium]